MRLLKKTFAILFAAAICGQAFSQVNVEVNFDIRHTVGGESVFNREKFITIHSANYETDWKNDSAKMEYLIHELNSYLSRETGNLNYWGTSYTAEALEGHGAWWKSTTYANNTLAHRFENNQNLIYAFQHTAYDLVSSGTELGERMVSFYENFHGTGGKNGLPHPGYIEIMNEPLFPLVDNGSETLEEIFQYHYDVAAKVKELNQNIKVGGFVQAFPELEKSNFQYWENRWKAYIDLCGDVTDFYSLHLYDFPGISGGQERYRKGANIEATLDMIESYSANVGKEKGFLISEYGSQLHDWYSQNWSSYRDWLCIKAFNNMLLQFLERPNRIEKALPFTPIKAEWGFGQVKSGLVYPWSLMRPADEAGYKAWRTAGNGIGTWTGEWVWSEYIKFYQLWADVNGVRIDTKSDDININVDAYVDGDTAYIILNSLNTADTDINISLAGLGASTITSATANVLYLNTSTNTVALDTNAFSTATNPSITLKPEATAIIKYVFNTDIAIVDTCYETKYYASKIKQQITANTPIVFNINNVETANYGEAVLRIGIGRDKVLSRNPQIIFNDSTLAGTINYRGDDQTDRDDFFGLLEIEIPQNLLRSNNEIQVVFTDDNGVLCNHISSCALQVFNFTKNLTRFGLGTDAVTAVKVEPKTLTFEQYDTVYLSAFVEPVTAADRIISWKSTDESKVVVNKYGEVYAKDYGTAEIVVQAHDETNGILTDTCYLTITEFVPTLVTGVILDKTTLSMDTDGTYDLTETVTPAYATDKSVKWSSSNTDVATVDSNGVITPIDGGFAHIIVTTNDQGFTDTCNLTVIAIPTTRVDIDKQLIGLATNDSVQLVATAYPANASNKRVTWSSTDVNIATVNQNGMVKITGTSGEANIVIVSQDSSILVDTCKVVIVNASNYITIEAEDLITTGGTYDDGNNDNMNVVAGLGVNYVNNGDWATYSVNIAEAGAYQVTYFISCPTDDGNITFSVGGVDNGKTHIENNGIGGTPGWETYIPIIASMPVNLASGNNDIKITATGSNWQWNLDKMVLVKVGDHYVAANDSEAMNIDLYPNPASSTLFIDGIDNNCFVSIYNIQGVEIVSSPIQTGDNSIDVSNIPDGYYIIVIKNNAETVLTTQKLIIKK